MAIVRAARAGNWSDTNPATSPWGWSGVLYPPASNDDVFANNFAITIDQNVTVTSISNASATSRTWKDGGTAAITATAGSGYFIVSSNELTISANASTGNVQSSCIRFTAASPAVLNFTGNLTSGGSANNPDGVIENQNTGTININSANIVGSNYSGNGVYAASAGTINLTGCTITGSSNAPNGSLHFAFGVLLSHANAVCNFNTCTINAGYSSWYNVGVGSTNTGLMNFTNCTINGNTTTPAISNRGGGTLTITNSTITAQNGVNAIVCSTSSTNRIAANLVSSANGTEPLGVYSTNGNQAIKIFLFNTPKQSYIQRALDGVSSLSFVKYFTADNTGLGPATNNVRSGVSYGEGLVGTCAVPAAGSVALGVAVDNTTGTAVLDPAAVASAVWGAASRTITGGVVDTLTNAPSVPSAATIASQVRTELGTELGRIDAAISSRLAPSGTLATVTTLTNAPSVPSAAAIASQVRTELSVELARVDAAITTRATPANIPAADITAIKAKTDAVNVDRINNTATLSQVGNLLAQANS